MKSSCAPYNHCKKGGEKKTKKQFFFNPKDPKNSYDNCGPCGIIELDKKEIIDEKKK